MRSSIIVLGFSLAVKCFCQVDIPLGTWRGHFSFNDIGAIAAGSNRIYATGEEGLLIINKGDLSLSRITKLNGLVGEGLNCVAINEERNTTMLGYQTGDVNLIAENKIISFDRFRKTSSISGSRSINHILIHQTKAFLSTDFGIAVFDLNSNEIQETYRDLNINGENLKINESIIFGDSIYAATESGVIANSLSNSNLLDYRSWKRYNTGPLAATVQSITLFDEHLFAAVDQSGIYKFENGGWKPMPYLQNENFISIYGSHNRLTITLQASVFEVDANDNVSPVLSGLILEPKHAIRDAGGVLWIADGRNGLISNISGSFEAFLPNGPTSNSVWRLSLTEAGVVSVHGGFSEGRLAIGNSPYVDIFTNGKWNAFTPSLSADLTDFDYSSGVSYVSSYSGGMEKIAAGVGNVFDETNSPLLKSGTAVSVTGISRSPEGVWVANYDSPLPLHLLRQDQTWNSFTFVEPQARYPLDVEISPEGIVWMILDPLHGGGLIAFNPQSNESVYLSSASGKGGLPTSEVYTVAFGRDGSVWIGASEGVAFFNSSAGVFSGDVDAIRPVIDNRFLLKDEVVTSIAVDGGNRKWIGTKNGVWLFDPDGEKLIYNFNVDNSPLPSNNIKSVAVDGTTGEVFFGTDRGIVSFRADATTGFRNFNSVKIFPNPVTRDFAGEIAITGLYADAIVKITDVSGRLVWETRANGGTATWNARSLNGNTVATGIYLVFLSDEDGSEKHVGKIAVIN